MFIWIDNGKYITAINKKYKGFLYLDKQIIFDDTENDFESNNILPIFINILDYFLGLISSK